ncbi:hypothetical protein C4D60_Mb04t39060 [Musa balbisiana]|uniref:Uncharacterized protein n=1 Tax=Musa balbisiana TaxID=52838 RepID=A0A4S8KHV1_MUSBA|nr:hypothetical protein C4D60_Mb04t39060 [Musa balbisiana]
MRKSVHVKWDLMETISRFFDPNRIQSWISSSLQSEEGNHQFELSGRTGTWRPTLLFRIQQLLLTPIHHAVSSSSSSCTIFTLLPNVYNGLAICLWKFLLTLEHKANSLLQRCCKVKYLMFLHCVMNQKEEISIHDRDSDKPGA